MYLESPPQNCITEELYLKNYNKKRKEMKSTSFPIWQDSKGLMPVKHCPAATSQSCSSALGSDLRSFFSLQCSFFFESKAFSYSFPLSVSMIAQLPLHNMYSQLWKKEPASSCKENWRLNSCLCNRGN